MRLPHLPSVLGRARDDRWSLLLAGGVVAFTALLAAAAPPAFRTVADEAVAGAAREAGPRADVLVSAPFERDDGPDGYRERDPRSAETVLQSAAVARFRLGPQLRAVLEPPVSTVAVTPLKLTDGSVQRTFQLAWTAGASEPAVSWTAGGPPSGTDPPAGPPGPAPWPVEVGLSEANAAALGLGVGDRVPAQDDERQPKDLRVSGVFRPADPADPAWRRSPALLAPVAGADGAGSTRIGGLLSRESLPDARLAVDAQRISVSIAFAPRPDRLTAAGAEELAAAITAVRSSAGPYTGIGWSTGLDRVLRDARARIDAAAGQASVLVAGLVLGAGLVLLLAAEQLARRRAAALGSVRRRGAGLPGTAAELLAESLPVALAAGAAGVLAARLATGGWSLRWALPVVAVAALAGPAFGTAAAARGTGRRAPANRTARRAAERTVKLRRITLEGAVVLAAAGAYAALRQRGLADGGAALPAAAPGLGAVAGGLLLPAGTGLALRRAARSRAAMPLLGAARLAATAARPLPVLAVVTCTALLAVALTWSATTRAGQAEGAWQAAGADARVDLAPAAAAAALARRLAAAPGVTAAVPAEVDDDVLVRAGGEVSYARLVVVDVAAFARLRAATPLPPVSGRLGTDGGRVPALSAFPAGTGFTVAREGRTVELVAAGPAPGVGEGDPATVLVDAARFAAAGAPVAPNTLWVAGSGARAAVAALPAGSGEAVLRADVVRARSTAPLAAGLHRLSLAVAAGLAALALLAVVLGASAAAPGRAETVARLRALGLPGRSVRTLTAAEVLPPVLLSAVTGAALGVLLALAGIGPLGLRRITGQAADPAPVLPWPALLLAVALLLLAAAAAIVAESAARRRERLGDVLRR